MNSNKLKRSMIINAEVCYDSRLQPGAKLLYGEIAKSSDKSGCCWESDKHFATLYGVTKTTVQRWLKALEESGYVERNIKYKGDTKEIEDRCIKVIQHTTR